MKDKGVLVNRLLYCTCIYIVGTTNKLQTLTVPAQIAQCVTSKIIVIRNFRKKSIKSMEWYWTVHFLCRIILYDWLMNEREEPMAS